MGGGLAFGGGQALVERRPAPAELLPGLATTSRWLKQPSPMW
jgi:hypothetical protein